VLNAAKKKKKKKQQLLFLFWRSQVSSCQQGVVPKHYQYKHGLSQGAKRASWNHAPRERGRAARHLASAIRVHNRWGRSREPFLCAAYCAFSRRVTLSTLLKAWTIRARIENLRAVKIPLLCVCMRSSSPKLHKNYIKNILSTCTENPQTRHPIQHPSTRYTHARLVVSIIYSSSRYIILPWWKQGGTQVMAACCCCVQQRSACVHQLYLRKQVCSSCFYARVVVDALWKPLFNWYSCEGSAVYYTYIWNTRSHVVDIRQL
jgi:hypothetical protein